MPLAKEDGRDQGQEGSGAENMVRMGQADVWLSSRILLLTLKYCRKLWVGTELRVFGGLHISSFWGSGYSGQDCKNREC